MAVCANNDTDPTMLHAPRGSPGAEFSVAEPKKIKTVEEEEDKQAVRRTYTHSLSKGNAAGIGSG